MKLVTIEAREVAGRPGVLLDGGVILDLSAAPGSLSASQWVPQSTISILAAGERGLAHAESLISLADEHEERLREDGALLKLTATALMAPSWEVDGQATRMARQPALLKAPTPL